MYLSSLTFRNFRCFQDTTVEFVPGLNLLIGENNSGKTAVISGLRLLFDRAGRSKPTFEDFHRPLAVKPDEPPSLAISATFRSLSHVDPDADDEEGDLSSEELRERNRSADSVSEKALVATWLTKVDDPWEASITYQFFLPESDVQEFRIRAARVNTEEEYADIVDEFLPRYVSRVWAGDPTNQNRAEPDLLSKISLSFLDALRDAQAELSSGRNALMKRLLSQILDQNITADERDLHVAEFQQLSGAAIGQLRSRLDRGTLFSLVESVGAKDGGSPDFQGKVKENELLAALRLFVQQQGFSHSLELNGLGYNNLIYISLVLASIRHESSKAVGENRVVYPMLAIEEPEAHLHPILQARLLSFVRKELAGNQAKQVFLTTHSTHITSQCHLSSLICLNREAGFQLAYPRLALTGQRESKDYLERYLDATKSNLLFLKGVILVEGPTELMLVSRFAKSLGISLQEHRVGVIVADGVCAKHFAHLFDLGGSDSPGLRVRLSCVVDADPQQAGLDRRGHRKWYKCYPYEVEPDNTDFKDKASHLTNLEDQVGSSSYVKVFHGQKTFEYDFALANLSASIITDVMTGPHKEKLAAYQQNHSLDTLDDDLRESIEKLPSDEERKLAGWATLYTQASGSKAEQAQAIAAKLSQKDHGINVPAYIKEAIKWACHKS